MATYLVVKRMNEDKVYLPGERIKDPANAEILVRRGYLVLVVADPEQAADSPEPAAQPSGAQPEVDPDDPELKAAADLLGLTAEELTALTDDEVTAKVAALSDDDKAKWEEIIRVEEDEAESAEPAAKKSTKKTK